MFYKVLGKEFIGTTLRILINWYAVKSLEKQSDDLKYLKQQKYKITMGIFVLLDTKR